MPPSTFNPNQAWVEEQARAFLDHTKTSGLQAKTVMHDRDTKFTASFDDVLESAGTKVRKSPFRSPNTVTFVERFFQTLQQETLDYFVVFGQQHMDYLLRDTVAHYHEERPHQGKDNALLARVSHDAKSKASEPSSGEPPPDVVPISQIECRQRLGGLLKHYYRKAA